MDSIPQASAALVWSFATLSLLVAACIPAGVFAAARRQQAPMKVARRDAAVAGVVVLLWMAATGLAAASGRLAFGPLPPPIGVLFVLILAGAFLLTRSAAGTRLAAGLPLSVLVGFHAFRLPLELLMHQAYTEGVMPVQMSYSGLNFDIATGASAIILAVMLASGRAPRRVVWLWNVAGTLLLANIVTIAWLSTPTPFRVFHNEPANVWITSLPFVWLPAVMVFAALVGHILVFRRLRLESALTVVSGRTAPAETVTSQ